MSYFEAATAGHDLTPYLRRRIGRFFKDAEDTLISLDGLGYHVSIGDQEFPLEYSLEAAVESVQGLLVSYRADDCLPFAVVVRPESETSWLVDMDVAVRDTRYALSYSD